MKYALQSYVINRFVSSVRTMRQCLLVTIVSRREYACTMQIVNECGSNFFAIYGFLLYTFDVRKKCLKFFTIFSHLLNMH